MRLIESFVFFDIETTGLPWQEQNRTKITELSFVAASRRDILKAKHGEVPPVSKISLVFNPQKPIHPVASKMTGLSNELLQHSPTFDQKVATILSFLQDLPKPVCLVAHNGNKFDYKIILAEFIDAKVNLPQDLLCIDSLIGFKQILSSNKPLVQPHIQTEKVVQHGTNFKISIDDLLTDDEDQWPDLNVSTEDWEDIDKICESLSDMSCEDTDNKQKKPPKTKVIKRKAIAKKGVNTNRQVYTLTAIYKTLLNRDAHNSHRAEGDCLMLLECVVATKDQFVPWADTSCKQLTDIPPLIRN